MFKNVISLILKLQNLQQYTDLTDFDSETIRIIQEIDSSNESIQQNKDNIDNIEIKSPSGSKIPSFYLRLMVYIYQNLVDFPPSNFT